MSDAMYHLWCNALFALIPTAATVLATVMFAALVAWGISSVRLEVMKNRRKTQDQFAEAMRERIAYQGTHEEALRKYEESKQKKLTM